MLEPLSVALAGIRRAGVGLGDSVLVCGAGPIGLVTAICCRAAGCEPIVITDIDEKRLEFAQDAVPGVRPLKIDANDTAEQTGTHIVKALGGSEPAVAIECTGAEASIAGAIQAVKFGGHRLCDWLWKERDNDSFYAVEHKEVDLKFQYRYSNTWPRAIRLLSSGLVDLRKLITHRYGLKDAVEAFKDRSGPKEWSNQGAKSIAGMIKERPERVIMPICTCS